jgi:hypothetical protein
MQALINPVRGGTRGAEKDMPDERTGLQNQFALGGAMRIDPISTSRGIRIFQQKKTSRNGSAPTPRPHRSDHGSVQRRSRWHAALRDPEGGRCGVANVRGRARDVNIRVRIRVGVGGGTRDDNMLMNEDQSADHVCSAGHGRSEHCIMRGIQLRKKKK